MTEITVSQARGGFAELISRVAYGHDRVIISKNGKNVAAVVPLEDMELLEALEDRLDIDSARKALKKPEWAAWSKVKADLGL